MNKLLRERIGKAARLGLLGLLAFSFAVMPAKPAHANIVQDVQALAEQISEWAVTAEQYILDAEQWITENVTQNSIVPGIVSGQAAQTQAQVYMTQATVDGQRTAQQANQIGYIQGHTTMSNSTITCATAKGGQARASSMAATRSMAKAVEGLQASVNAGASGAAGTAASASTEVNDLCQLGFLVKQGATTSRYGTLPTDTGKKCKDPSGTGKYVDADIKLSSVIDQLQFPLPQSNKVAITPDGHVSFLGQGKTNPVNWQPTDTTNGPDLGSEMDFAAAYKFCEHLSPLMPSPTVNAGTPTAADNVYIKNDRDLESLRTAAADECFRAVWYRMACPDGTDNVLQSVDAAGNTTNNTLTCSQAQKKMCDRLVWLPPNGLGLTLKGSDPRFTQALTNCLQVEGNWPTTGNPGTPPSGTITAPTGAAFLGLSAAMYDAIIAHKCDDANYTSTMADNIRDTAEFEQLNQFDCPRQEADYEAMMDNERERLEVAISNLIQMQGMGLSVSQTSRISK